MVHLSATQLASSVALFFLFALVGCSKERVILLQPKQDDLVVLNGCLI